MWGGNVFPSPPPPPAALCTAPVHGPTRYPSAACPCHTRVSGRVFLLTSCVSPHTRPLRVRVIRVLGSVFLYTPRVSPHARPPVNPRDFHLPRDCVTRVSGGVFCTHRVFCRTPRVAPAASWKLEPALPRTCLTRLPPPPRLSSPLPAVGQTHTWGGGGGGGDCWSAWTRAAGGSPRPRLCPTIERPVIVLAISSPQRKVTRPCQANLTKPNAADVCVCVCVLSPAA